MKAPHSWKAACLAILPDCVTAMEETSRGAWIGTIRHRGRLLATGHHGVQAWMWRDAYRFITSAEFNAPDAPLAPSFQRVLDATKE